MWRRSSGHRNATGRRLGPLEYALIALIGLSVGITIAMALINPSA
jgi:hypothetical protein